MHTQNHPNFCVCMQAFAYFACTRNSDRIMRVHALSCTFTNNFACTRIRSQFFFVVLCRDHQNQRNSLDEHWARFKMLYWLLWFFCCGQWSYIWRSSPQLCPHTDCSSYPQSTLVKRWWTGTIRGLDLGPTTASNPRDQIIEIRKGNSKIWSRTSERRSPSGELQSSWGMHDFPRQPPNYCSLLEHSVQALTPASG